jgi:nucleotide-binding universal stress UspA family protein
VLTGRPDRALRAYAVAHGFDVIVVGNRGHGMSNAVLGSVATRLASQGEIPVLVAGVPARDRLPA